MGSFRLSSSAKVRLVTTRISGGCTYPRVGLILLGMSRILPVSVSSKGAHSLEKAREVWQASSFLIKEQRMEQTEEYWRALRKG